MGSRVESTRAVCHFLHSLDNYPVPGLAWCTAQMRGFLRWLSGENITLAEARSLHGVEWRWLNPSQLNPILKAMSTQQLAIPLHHLHRNERLFAAKELAYRAKLALRTGEFAALAVPMFGGINENMEVGMNEVALKEVRCTLQAVPRSVLPELIESLDPEVLRRCSVEFLGRVDTMRGTFGHLISMQRRGQNPHEPMRALFEGWIAYSQDARPFRRVFIRTIFLLECPRTLRLPLLTSYPDQVVADYLRADDLTRDDELFSRMETFRLGQSEIHNRKEAALSLIAKVLESIEEASQQELRCYRTALNRRLRQIGADLKLLQGFQSNLKSFMEELRARSFRRELYNRFKAENNANLCEIMRNGGPVELPEEMSEECMRVEGAVDQLVGELKKEMRVLTGPPAYVQEEREDRLVLHPVYNSESLGLIHQVTNRVLEDSELEDDEDIWIQPLWEGLQNLQHRCLTESGVGVHEILEDRGIQLTLPLLRGFFSKDDLAEIQNFVELRTVTEKKVREMVEEVVTLNDQEWKQLPWTLIGTHFKNAAELYTQGITDLAKLKALS